MPDADAVQTQSVAGGLLVQRPDLGADDAADWQVVTRATPTDDVWAALGQQQPHFPANPAGAADDNGDLAAELTLGRHPLQLGFLERPVFDPEGLGSRQRHVVAVALELSRLLRVAGLRRRAGFRVVFGGAGEEQQRARRDFAIAIGLALALVYMVMAGQFERFLDPLVVMFSVPVAVIGIVPTLLLTGTTLNVLPRGEAVTL